MNPGRSTNSAIARRQTGGPASPDWRARFRAGDDISLDAFVQEVRRFYPFFPAVAARVRTKFTLQGMHFPKGRRVILDLFGTDRDARTWSEPHEFCPERFQEEDGGAFGFIPQGGGEVGVQHRCPGEPVTIELMKVAVQFLSARITYDVPGQDLDIAWSRLPALPYSRMIIRDVRAATTGPRVAPLRTRSDNPCMMLYDDRHFA